MRFLELETATGLLVAMNLASSSAPLMTSSLPPSKTFDTSPNFSASIAENGRVVYVSSRTRESFPVIFGRKARVPM